MQDDDARIDALMREVQKRRGERSVAVSDEAVHAYLTGRASAAQKSEVRRALLQSVEFRNELLELSSHLETLAGADAAARFEAASAPAPPADLTQRAGRGRGEEDVSLLRRLGAAVAELLAPARRFLEESLQWRVLAPVGAVAALALAVAPRLYWSPIAAPSARTALNPGLFATAPGQTRGGEPEDHAEAARLELRRCVRLRDGRFVFEPVLAPSVTDQQRVEVQLVGDWRRKLRSVVLAVPAGTSAAPAMVWLAFLPPEGDLPVEVRSYPVSDGSTAVRWDAEGTGRGVLFVTYERDGGFEASPCMLVDLGSR